MFWSHSYPFIKFRKPSISAPLKICLYNFFVVLAFFDPPTSTSDKLSLGSLCSYQLALINDLFPRHYELSLGCLQCSVDKTTCKTIYYIQVPSGHLNKDMTGLTAGEVWTQHCGTHTVTYLQNMQCSGHFFTFSTAVL